MNNRWLAIAVLAAATVALVVAAWAAMAASGRLLDRVGDGQAVFITLCALAAPALASAMVRRHPDEWHGPLVGLMVLCAMVGAARGVPLGVLTPIAGAIALTTVLLPGVVALHHPTLARPATGTRVVVGCAWVTAGCGVLVVVVEAGRPVPVSWWYTDTPGAAGPLAVAVILVHTAAAVVGGLATAMATIARYRSLPHGARPVLRPVVVPLVGWAAAMIAGAVWSMVAAVGSPRAELTDASRTVFGIVPVIFVAITAAGIGWVDLMVRRPTGAASSAASREARQRPGDQQVQRLLSRALADPTVQVRYPAGDGDGWLDSRGQPAVLAPPAAERSTTLIRRNSGVIGLIEHDAAVTAKPDAVELVATGAGLAMETERLTAAARGDLERSRLLAERLLSAADAPRSELRARMVDGPIGDLDAIAARLRAGGGLAATVGPLTAVAATVRSISHGLLPAALGTGGLAAALPEADIPDRRYPQVIELTLLLAAGRDPAPAVADVMLGSGAGVLLTTSARPEPAVSDRVTALGGTVEPVAGRWRVELPVPISAGPANG